MNAQLQEIFHQDSWRGHVVRSVLLVTLKMAYIHEIPICLALEFAVLPPKMSPIQASLYCTTKKCTEIEKNYKRILISLKLRNYSDFYSEMFRAALQ